MARKNRCTDRQIPMNLIVIGDLVLMSATGFHELSRRRRR